LVSRFLSFFFPPSSFLQHHVAGTGGACSSPPPAVRAHIVFRPFSFLSFPFSPPPDLRQSCPEKNLYFFFGLTVGKHRTFPSFSSYTGKQAIRRFFPASPSNRPFLALPTLCSSSLPPLPFIDLPPYRTIAPSKSLSFSPPPLPPPFFPPPRTSRQVGQTPVFFRSVPKKKPKKNPHFPSPPPFLLLPLS